MGDMMIHASATLQKSDGTWTEPKPGKVRFGTRITLPDGQFTKNGTSKTKGAYILN